MYLGNQREGLTYVGEGCGGAVAVMPLAVKLGQVGPFGSTATPYSMQSPFLKLVQSLCSKTVTFNHEDDFLRILSTFYFLSSSSFFFI
jgi:hypothetical protein